MYERSFKILKLHVNINFTEEDVKQDFLNSILFLRMKK